MGNIYQDGAYLCARPTWHAEDSPWKAAQIARMMNAHGLRPRTIAEIGCGVGQILQRLSEIYPNARCFGYDISPHAIATASKMSTEQLTFQQEDPLSSPQQFDLLMAIDVFEHVPDYMGFLSKCREKAEFKIYHIPLDMHVSGLLRNGPMLVRHSVGHLHYFYDKTALAVLKDTGHEIIDWFYTSGGTGLFWQHPSLKRAIGNSLRWALEKFNKPFTSRLIGGYSLMVLCR